MSGHDNDEADSGPPLVTNRTVDIAVATILLALSLLVISESLKLGRGWIEGQGPAPGYFPFYIALALGIGSAMNLVRAFMRVEKNGGEAFVGTLQFGRVLSVLVPTIGYVLAIQFLGIYVASAIFIAAFMTYFGGDSLFKSVAVGIGVPIAIFFMFEKWFLVPLPKGPLEAVLGLG
jgi:hypothetical protein